MIDVRSHDFLCQNFSESYTKPIAVMPDHLWLGAIPQNPYHVEWFDRNFGRDEFGVVPFVRSVGSWFFRPIPSIQRSVKSLADLLRRDAPGMIYGLQIRTGMSGDTYRDRPPLESAPEFVRCAYAYTPLKRRGNASAWIIASDTREAKRLALIQIARTEGPIVAAGNEAALRDRLQLPADLFAAGGALGVPPGRIRDAPMGRDLARMGFALAVFASGARAVVLAGPPAATSAAGMAAAVVEMWLLSVALILVVAENSTFWLPAVSFVGGAGRGAYVMTRGRRCYPLPSREPVSDAGLPPPRRARALPPRSRRVLPCCRPLGMGATRERPRREGLPPCGACRVRAPDF